MNRADRRAAARGDRVEGEWLSLLIGQPDDDCEWCRAAGHVRQVDEDEGDGSPAE